LSLVLCEVHEQAKWVAYSYDERTVSVIKRSVSLSDPKGLTEVRNGDYRRSGYDKGHLAPAEDMGYQLLDDGMFLLSNMSPQNQVLPGIWKKLEELIGNGL
jgi:endonuclease G